MLFQTYQFLVLMLVVLAGIALLRQPRSQHWLLLVGSYVFYGWWDIRFLALLLLTSMIDYSAALGMAGVKLPWSERLRLSAILLVGTLLFLGPDWPAVQHGTGPVTLQSFLTEGYKVTKCGIVACSAFALVGPVIYGFYFRLAEDSRRRAFLITSVIGNLAVLGFFKYFNFFRENLVDLSYRLGYQWAIPELSIALPVGISFYTFVTMSYGIDAYRRQLVPERSFVRMALFVAYFPHLVAGPIIRPEQLLPTLNTAWKLNAQRITSGFHLALVGLVKKVLIADSVQRMVVALLDRPQGLPSLLIMLGALLFAVQIYCDFSGYTDIARGVSRMLGVELPLNFNFPYFSTSIIDFWRRWHISLSSWLRDYLYIPLGGGRVSPSRVYFNLMTTMVLGGLWHGASWNFVIWGAYQGALLCVNRLFGGLILRSALLSHWFETRLARVLCWAVTLYFVLLGWLIFYVKDLHQLLYAMKAYVFFDFRFDVAGPGLGSGSPVIALSALGIFVLLHAVSFFKLRWAEFLDRLPRPVLPVAYAFLGLVFFFAWPSEDAPFIYFQF